MCIIYTKAKEENSLLEHTKIIAFSFENIKDSFCNKILIKIWKSLIMCLQHTRHKWCTQKPPSSLLFFFIIVFPFATI